MVALLALFVGCAPTPASIKFDGDAKVSVNKLDQVDVLKATVLDAEGKAIEPQPALTWTVSPDSVAKLEGAKVTPIANGEATVTAAVGEVKNKYTFVVALPDKVEIAGYTAGTAWPVGQSAQLTATVKAGETALTGETVTWSSNADTVATVAADGTVMGVAAGMATITATSGALTSTVDVTIGDAAVAATDAAPK
ncbi:MAG: Ig-like domain-containing protein [Pseudomonadota bacterium]|nr:Ig-like domain-containing protein [Pseudomonadota bacterium]